MKIALIVGHSEASQGAKNSNLGITEFQFNSILVQDIITNYNRVVNRSIDLVPVFRDTYQNLPNKVNNTNADLAISFHCNAYNTQVSGSEVLYYHASVKGKKIANIIQGHIVDAMGLRSRGIKGIRSKDRGGYLLVKTKMPCVIVEPFFIDNDKDCYNARLRYGGLVTGFIRSIILCCGTKDCY